MNTLTQAFRSARAQAWWPRALGFVAVVMFAMTIPMTRMANGSAAEPQWPPLFVASARAALAGCLALAHLWWVRAAWPAASQRKWLLGVMLGGVLGFPMGMGWAVRTVPAAHAAVLTGLLPLVTAALAAWWLGHRPRMGFWFAGMAGAGLIVSFVLANAASQPVPAASVRMADACLVLALLGASVAYVAGARLAREMPSSHVMSWSLVLAWPLTLALSWCFWPQGIGSADEAWQRIGPGAWLGLAYVAVCSTWLGFFFWYAALARDAMRVTQLQLLQPFLAIVMAAWLLHEAVPPSTWLYALAVLVTVGIGQRFARPAVPASAPSSAVPITNPAWRRT